MDEDVGVRYVTELKNYPFVNFIGSLRHAQLRVSIYILYKDSLPAINFNKAE